MSNRRWSGALDADDRVALEEERDFLLNSIADLERERDEGSLAADDYERLRDDYTARAADVLRALSPSSPPPGGRLGGGDSPPRATPGGRSVGRRIGVGVGIGVFALAAALLLTRSLGERLPGESATGNDQLRSEYATLIADADELAAQGEGADALELYDRAARIDPKAAQPRARAALIVFQAGLVDQAVSRLDEAEAVDPEYAETWFVRGIVLLQGRGDQSGARSAFARYLELDPDGPYAEDATIALRELDAAAQDPEEPEPTEPQPQEPTEE